MDSSNYWSERAGARLTRRRALGAAITASLGLAATAVGACGGENKSASSPTAERRAASAGSGIASATGTVTVPASTPNSAAVARAASATPTSAGEQPVLGGTLSQPSGDNGRLDPAQDGAGLASLNLWTAYDHLNYIELGYKIAPAMAALPEQPDGTTLIYKIRPDVFWHDKPPLNGRQFTAEDAVFGLQRFGTNKPQFIYKDRFAGVRFEAIDKLTLRISTAQAYAPLSVNVAEDATVMIAREIVEAFGDDGIMQDPAKAIGTGPFMFGSRVKDSETVLLRNPRYYAAPRPYFDQLKTPWLLDAGRQYAAFIAGQTDFLSWSFGGGKAQADTAKAQIGADKVATYSRPTNNGFAPVFNCTVKPFDDPRVRKALHLAANREQVAAGNTQSGEWLPWGPIAEVLAPYGLTQAQLAQRPGYRSGKDRDQDLKDARALLSAAGVDLKNIPKMLALAPPGDSSQAQVLQQNWKEIGWDQAIDEQQFAAAIAAHVAGNFALSTYADEGGSDPDFLYAKLHTGGGANYGKFSSAEIDALLEKGRSTLDANERKKIYDAMQDKLLTDLNPRVWCVSSVHTLALRPNLRGFRPIPGITSQSHVFSGMWRAKT